MQMPMNIMPRTIIMGSICSGLETWFGGAILCRRIWRSHMHLDSNVTQMRPRKFKNKGRCMILSVSGTLTEQYGQRNKTKQKTKSILRIMRQLVSTWRPIYSVKIISVQWLCACKQPLVSVAALLGNSSLDNQQLDMATANEMCDCIVTRSERWLKEGSVCEGVNSGRSELGADLEF